MKSPRGSEHILNGKVQLTLQLSPEGAARWIPQHDVMWVPAGICGAGAAGFNHCE